MKLNKITSMFKQHRHTNRNVKLFGATLATLLAAPTFAQETTDTASSGVEVIQVKGIAGSLAESARLKRFDSRIVDAIVAEDIGKLPDNNIAEALQRITGVSISSDFGVGNSVTIRGISQNRVELNGRSTSGSARNGISLEDFPSSFLKTVEVIKSPTPEMIEGSLGGTINMKTVRPLELDEPLVAFSLDAEYADKTKNTAPKFNISGGKNWDLGDAGTFGASAVLAYQDRELRRDEYITLVTPTALDLDGDGNIDQSNSPSGNYLVRSQNTLEQKTEQRERTALGLSLQWAPQSSDGFIYLDINSTELDGGQEAYAIGNDSKDYDDLILDNAYGDAQGQLNNFGSGSAFVQPKTQSDFTTSETVSNALGGEYQITDQLLISAEIAYTTSEERRRKSEFNLRPIDRELYDADGTVTERLLTVTLNEVGDQVPGLTFSYPTAITDGENQAIRQFSHQRYNTDNEETAFRIDVEYTEPFASLEFLSSVKMGIRTTDRDYELTRADLRNSGGDGVGGSELKNLQTSVTVDGVVTPTFVNDFNEEFGGFTTINHGNTFEQNGDSGGNALTNFFVYDAALLAYDIEGTYDRVQRMLTGTSHELTGSLEDNMVANNGSYAHIEEKTRALYTQFDLDFGDLTAIVGARYVETDLTSSIIDQSNTNEYSDFLPSINATYNLSEETLVRFAAAKVMRRAGFGDLSPAVNIDNSLVTGDQGAYQLDPFRVTQYDLSVEHYFGKGGVASAAIFYKDVESFTQSSSFCLASSDTALGQNVTEFVDVCFLDSVGVNNPDLIQANTSQGQDLAFVEARRDAGLTGIVIDTTVNGGSGKVAGLELAYQQQLSFVPGLGVNVNYTYSDSEQPDGNQLLDTSKNQFNGQIYWESENIQLRLAYNWRDSYLDTQDEKRVRPVGALAIADADDVTRGNNYRDARGQLDFSASYDINDNFTVVANVVNLLGEPTTFSTELDSIWKYSESDARYTLGLRGKF
ncbi:MAG: TonB-dependent receptor [Paraglaciecola sp.]|uniref:TonB-dependent receptor n=3 Tax=Paraglaciecola sp. TaxID=1920173 RepID=UPI00326504DA